MRSGESLTLASSMRVCQATMFDASAAWRNAPSPGAGENVERQADGKRS
jgi:hypothetical protein